jgi:aminopeptidase YwaD
VTRGPMSLPSFVHDVAWAFAEFVNEESYKFAATGKADYPFVAPEGGKEPLRAEYSAYTMGSDHDVYQDSSFGIPAIYLNDWPDRYIHTNFDTAANIDPTKLKRAAFIGAASGYFLASFDLAKIRVALDNEYQADLAIDTLRGGRGKEVEGDEYSNLLCHFEEYTHSAYLSMQDFFRGDSPGALGDPDAAFHHIVTPCRIKYGKNPYGQLRFGRKREHKGPLAVFGYGYFAEHAKAEGVATPKLLSYEGLWGAGEEYTYEVLNFANGKRNAQEICDAVSAEYGPVPLDLVVEYLRALEKIGVIDQVK